MQSIVYLNGEFMAESDAVVPVTSRGFFGGDGIYEVTRTFDGALFRVDDHLARLARSLAYVRINTGLSSADLATATVGTLDRNRPRLNEVGDFALWHVIARGDAVDGAPADPIVAIFCIGLDFDHYAAAYLEGVRLVTPGVRRTPPQSIDPRGKVTSRMNQIQAALEVSRTAPGAVPLMLDIDGNLAETNTGNFFFFRDGKLCTPRSRNVLAGVTRTVVIEIAETLGLEMVEGDFTAYDVYTADEAFVSGTSPSIVPVVSLNGALIGSAEALLPGDLTLRFMRAFSDLVGVDYVAQAIGRIGGNRSGDLAEVWAARLAA